MPSSGVWCTKPSACIEAVDVLLLHVSVYLSHGDRHGDRHGDVSKHLLCDEAITAPQKHSKVRRRHRSGVSERKIGPLTAA